MDDAPDTKQPPDRPMPRIAARQGKKTVPDAAFDLWLRRGLHAMYDDVAREPVPEELLRLIEQDRQK